MKFLFWSFLGLIVYCYFGYPFLLSLVAKVGPKKIRKSGFQPNVSIVISVCNEEDVIEAKLRNFLSLDYPKGKLQIIIGSDGSSDRTNEIIKKFSDPRIQFFEFTTRQGKIKILNQLIQKVKDEVVVFTDARQILAQDAIRELVKNFADPQIGCVSGELEFLQKEGGTAKGVQLYWEYEKFIRKNESNIHSMLGATGAIYAIRRELYRNPPENIILDDMYVPFKIIEQGYRAIFDDSAKAYDEVADSPREEYRRKTRTLFGNYQIFAVLPQMFNPWRSAVAVQLFSHKFLRVIAPILLIIIFGPFTITVEISEEILYCLLLALNWALTSGNVNPLRFVSRGLIEYPMSFHSPGFSTGISQVNDVLDFNSKLGFMLSVNIISVISSAPLFAIFNLTIIMSLRYMRFLLKDLLTEK